MRAAGRYGRLRLVFTASEAAQQPVPARHGAGGVTADVAPALEPLRRLAAGRLPAPGGPVGGRGVLLSAAELSAHAASAADRTVADRRRHSDSGGLCAGGDRPSGVAAAAGAGGTAPGRTVRDRRFSATQRHRLLYCHRRRGAAVADGRRPLCLPQRREGEISSVGKRARARAALRHADPAEIPHRMAGRRGLLADDGDHFLLLAVTPLRRARGMLACRTGAGGRRAAGACPAIGLVTQRPA